MSNYMMLDDFLEDLARKCRIKRQFEGESLATVAEKTGLDLENYRQFESGRRNPSLKTLRRLIVYFFGPDPQRIPHVKEPDWWQEAVRSRQKWDSWSMKGGVR